MLPATRQWWESRLYPQPKQVLDLATLERCKAELTYVTWKWAGRELKPRPVNRKSNALPLSHHSTHQQFQSMHWRTLQGYWRTTQAGGNGWCGWYTQFALATCRRTYNIRLCLLLHLVHNNRAPSCLADSVTITANFSRRTRLRSTSSRHYQQPWTRLKLGERSFAFAGPAAWNTSNIHLRTVWHWKFQMPPQNCSLSAMLRLQYLVLISFLFLMFYAGVSASCVTAALTS